jgi:hypothetical protein
MAFLREDAIQAISFSVTPAKAGVTEQVSITGFLFVRGVSGVINCFLKKGD